MLKRRIAQTLGTINGMCKQPTQENQNSNQVQFKPQPSSDCEDLNVYHIRFMFWPQDSLDLYIVNNDDDDDAIIIISTKIHHIPLIYT